MPRYFAYCTLLDTSEMRRFCPNAVASGVARLSGYRVAFAHYGSDDAGGGCNLDEAPGHEIFGLIHELSDEEFDQLDMISGVDRGYYRRVEFAVTTEDGRDISVATYVMPSPGGPFQPTTSYTQPIIDGAIALGLPQSYQAELTEIVRAAISGEKAG